MLLMMFVIVDILDLRERYSMQKEIILVHTILAASKRELEVTFTFYTCIECLFIAAMTKRFY